MDKGSCTGYILIVWVQEKLADYLKSIHNHILGTSYALEAVLGAQDPVDRTNTVTVLTESGQEAHGKQQHKVTWCGKFFIRESGTHCGCGSLGSLSRQWGCICERKKDGAQWGSLFPENYRHSVGQSPSDPTKEAHIPKPCQSSQFVGFLSLSTKQRTFC